MSKAKGYCLKEILEKAAQYEAEGKQELADKWFKYAERYEEIMKRVRHNIANRQIFRK